jgi:uncharacterized membrane protein YbaN (DUF454 family)
MGEARLQRLVLITVGGVATALAIVGAMLPGLPTTPFLLVALWAFARSSDALHDGLSRVPLLRHGLAEARRFEERRAIRARIKLLALAMAWGSVVATLLWFGAERPGVLAGVIVAALSATAAMLWIPTDTSR